MDIVSELVCKAEIDFECEKCGEKYKVSIDKDFVIKMPSGLVVHKCKKCNQEHTLSLGLSILKEGVNNE